MPFQVTVPPFGPNAPSSAAHYTKILSWLRTGTRIPDPHGALAAAAANALRQYMGGQPDAMHNLLIQTADGAYGHPSYALATLAAVLDRESAIRSVGAVQAGRLAAAVRGAATAAAQPSPVPQSGSTLPIVGSIVGTSPTGQLAAAQAAAALVHGIAARATSLAAAHLRVSALDAMRLNSMRHAALAAAQAAAPDRQRMSSLAVQAAVRAGGGASLALPVAGFGSYYQSY